MSDAPERLAFVVGRVAKDGRLDFDRVAALAASVLGRPLTPEELARQRARWRARFPHHPETDEPPR